MAGGSPQPFIRAYRPEDKLVLAEICRVTAHKGLQPIADYVPLVFADPYTFLEPENVFVLDPDDGTAAKGYIIGVPDTQKFMARWREEYIPTLAVPVPESWDDANIKADTGLDPEIYSKPHVRSEDEVPESLLQQRPHVPLWLMNAIFIPEYQAHKGKKEMVSEYPSHFHIDILPEYQRRGFGAQLIKTFLDRMKELGASGVHVIPSSDNLDAIRFYQREGFEILKYQSDPGTEWLGLKFKN